MQAAANKALAATAYAKPVYKVTMKARPMGMTATQVQYELTITDFTNIVLSKKMTISRCVSCAVLKFAPSSTLKKIELFSFQSSCY